jgi:hypothetical protein
MCTPLDQGSAGFLASQGPHRVRPLLRSVGPSSVLGRTSGIYEVGRPLLTLVSFVENIPRFVDLDRRVPRIETTKIEHIKDRISLIYPISVLSLVALAESGHLSLAQTWENDDDPCRLQHHLLG